MHPAIPQTEVLMETGCLALLQLKAFDSDAGVDRGRV